MATLSFDGLMAIDFVLLAFYCLIEAAAGPIDLYKHTKETSVLIGVIIYLIPVVVFGYFAFLWTERFCSDWVVYNLGN